MADLAVAEFNVSGSRADLYELLAETLAGVPDWLLEPVQSWPLYETAAALATASPAAARAVGQLASVPAEDSGQRRVRYDRLFAGPGEPRFWLNESAYREGSILGASTTAVGRLYQAAGLEIVGAELPDHASVELGFLAYLANQQEQGGGEQITWRQLERLFIKRHAGNWLPQLGWAIAATGDPVYGPIGVLLAGWVQEAYRPVPEKKHLQLRRLPMLQQPHNCTLCGFCVQSCPTKALSVVETDNVTALHFQPSLCTACQRCVNICNPAALMMAEVEEPPGREERKIMVESPRLTCRSCGAPTYSQAEMAFVKSQLGDLDWLAYCLSCRQKQL